MSLLSLLLEASLMEQDQQVPRVHTKVHACHHDYPHQQQQYFDDNSSYNMKADEAESKDNKKKEQEQKGKRRGSGWPKGSRNKKTGLVKLDADISLSVAHGSSYIDDKTFMIKTETTKTREILLGTLKKGTKKHKMTVKNSRKRNKGTNKNKKVSSFVCSVCYREFNRNSNLTRHKRIHSNERRFACEYCPKTFMEKHHLQAHSRTHSGARPFRCLCEVTFADKSNLKRHILNCKRLEAIQAEDNRAYTQTRKQVHIKACDESYRSDGNNEKSFSRRQSTRKRKQTSAPQQARTSSSYYGDYDSGGSDDDGDRIEDCMPVVERQSREQRKKKQPASPCSTSSAAKSAAAPLLLSSSFSPSPLSSPLLALGRGMSPFFLPAPQTTVLFSSPSSLSSPPSPPVPPFLSEAAAVGAATLPHRLMALTVPEVSSSNQLFSSPHKRRKLAIQREFLTPPFNHQQYHPHQGLNTQSNDGGGLFWLDASQHTVISTSTYHANITQNNINQSQITSKATSHKAPPRRAPRRAASKGVRALIQKMQMDSLNHQKREEEAKQERERVLRRGYDTEASVEDDNDNCDNDVNIDANTNFAPIFTDGGADASAGTSIGTRYRTSTGFLSSLLKLL